MKIEEATIAGVYKITPPVFKDHRGEFVKTYHRETFEKLKIPFVPAEEFYSTSNKNVLRGMHFQIPPADHAKVVICLRGSALDVVLDLRKGSPTMGKSCSFPLNETDVQLIYMPAGIAHGFLSMEDKTVLYYSTSTVHSPTCDSGIRWDSFGFAWPVENPIISDRDNSFSSFGSFVSPFLL